MKKTILILILLMLTVAVGFLAFDTRSGKEDTKELALTDPQLIMRGEYLVNAIGCDDCHSPKKMGPMGPEIIPELRFSGFTQGNKIPAVDTTEINKGWFLMNGDLTSSVGQWGASFAANISSDATGIGNWKEEQFFRAIREGKSKGLANNRPLLPPMPWFVYKNFNDHDLKAIFAFLKSTKPVKNVVPQPVAFKDLK